MGHGEGSGHGVGVTHGLGSSDGLGLGGGEAPASSKNNAFPPSDSRSVPRSGSPAGFTDSKEEKEEDEEDCEGDAEELKELFDAKPP